MLFWVDTRGVESSRPLPAFSRADRATSRLIAPFTEPSARPRALLAPFTPRFTTEFVVSAGSPDPWTPVVRPEMLPVLGNANGSGLPVAAAARPLKPHCTP